MRGFSIDTHPSNFYVQLITVEGSGNIITNMDIRAKNNDFGPGTRGIMVHGSVTVTCMQHFCFFISCFLLFL